MTATRNGFDTRPAPIAPPADTAPASTDAGTRSETTMARPAPSAPPHTGENLARPAPPSRGPEATAPQVPITAPAHSAPGSTVAPPESAAATPEAPPPPALPPPPTRPRRWRRWPVVVLALLALALTIGAALAWQAGQAPGNREASGPAPQATPVPRLIARAQVRPVHQARVGTLAGGVVDRIVVDLGDGVAAGQEVARVRGVTGDVEVLTAPWSGVVSARLANVGDTVVAGTTIVQLVDPSQLQIETLDVDEFLIEYVTRGQMVTMTVDALEGVTLLGQVRAVAVQPQVDATGDAFYPVIIDPIPPARALRPGMTVRVNFAR